MGQGYTRNDVSNNIDNGNVINADDFDGEFEAIDSAFTAGTGHTHDGTTGEGGPVSIVGPSQDVVFSETSVLPKTTATLDLGSSLKTFKDAYFSGEVTATDFSGTLTGNVTGNLTGNADTADAVNNALTVGSGLTLSSGATYDGSAAVTITHEDTSSQTSVNNSDGSVIQDISVDTYGHITSITSTDLDARYAELSGATFTGQVKTTATNSSSVPPLALADGDTGPRGFTGTGTANILVVVNGTSAAIFEPSGTTASNTTTVMTREKADVRFAGVSSQTGTTSFNFPLMMTLHITNGFVPDRNSVVSVYPLAGNKSYTTNIVFADGPALSGTWRAAGGANDNFIVVKTAL